MSKELITLEKLMNGCCDTCTSGVCSNKRNGACRNFKNYKIIQKALIEKENTEKTIDKLFGGNGIKVVTAIDIQNRLEALNVIKELLDLKVVQLLPNDRDTRLFIRCDSLHVSVLIPPPYINLLKEALL